MKNHALGKKLDLPQRGIARAVDTCCRTLPERAPLPGRQSLPGRHDRAYRSRFPLVGRGFTLFLILIVTIVGQITARAETIDRFEDETTSWTPAASDVSHRVQQHQRTGDGLAQSRCEQIAILATTGTHVYYSHPIPESMVIDELKPAVSVCSDRDRISIAARVVLPRTNHPKTGRPMTFLIYGDVYNQTGRWQTIAIEEVPQKVADYVRVARFELKIPIDPREAYIDLVLLNVYGGPGETTVWIDDLKIDGMVPRPNVDVQTEPMAADRAVATTTSPYEPNRVMSAVGSTAENAYYNQIPGSVRAAQATEPIGASPGESPYLSSNIPGRRRVELEGTILNVDGMPFFPRVIEYQGEPLPLLFRLGFNAIWLRQPPSVELLTEARRVGLWVICPPPPGVTTLDAPIFEPVLAWWLGSDVYENDIKGKVVDLARRVRAADRTGRRPLVCAPRTGLELCSRHVDLLWLDRQPLGTDLEIRDYGTWIRSRGQLARPGTPVWTSIQTQPSAAAILQMSLAGMGQPPTTAPVEQMRLLALTSIAAGSRAVVFRSASPLSLDDPQTQQRAAALELLNLELDLIHPWTSAGTVTSLDMELEVRLEGGPKLIASVIHVDRGRLVLPIWARPSAQFATGQAAGYGLSVVVPGLPKSTNVYELAPSELQPLQLARVTGGTRIDMDEFDLCSMLLVSQDPLIISTSTRRATASGRRAAELERQLAAARIAQAGQIVASLRQSGRSVPNDQQWLALAQQQLTECDRVMHDSRWSSGRRHARRAARTVRLLERTLWQQAVGQLTSPMTSPTASGFTSLAGHSLFLDRLAMTPLGPNQLVGGDFEDARRLTQVGWRHGISANQYVRAAADLLPSAAHSGRLGLRLSAHPAVEGGEAMTLESPPVWITTAPLQVRQGQIVRISGYARVDRPLAGTVDGLMIVDSIGGEDLAYRIQSSEKGSNWRRFVTYRIARTDGPMSVSFVLTGMGEALLDDVKIEPLVELPAQRPTGTRVQ